jgi:adenylate cyclase
LILAEPDRLSPEVVAEHWQYGGASAALRDELARLPPHDPQLAAALAAAPSVLGFAATDGSAVLPPERASFALAGDNPQAFVPSFAGAITSLPAFLGAAKGSGALNWLPDPDLVVRRLPMLIATGDRLNPSFAAEMLRVAQGVPTILVKASNASGVEAFGQRTGISAVRIGGITVPTDAEGQVWVHFTRHEPRRFIPAWQVLDGTIPADAIAGRIVLVGATAAGLLDLRSTPLDSAVPGVEVQAQVIEQLIAGIALRRPDFTLAAELLFILMTGLGVALLTQKAGAVLGAGLGAVSFAAIGFGSWLAFSRQGFLIDPLFPALAVTLIYIAGTLYLYLRTEIDRRQVRSAFSRYMAPAMVERLASDPSRLELGGVDRELTLLFADVRGFTAISERLDAQALIRFVNRLFTPLTDVILAEKGTIDKFMGDAVMAFWNAPLDDPNHAANACRAALRMQEELARLNGQWAREAEAGGTRHEAVRIGIGLNTGLCCVGNLGSEQRFDYSVIGDDVNVAARLEQLTKQYGVPIIAGEATMRAAPDFAFLPIEPVAVRGKRAAQMVYALLGDERYRGSAAFAQLSGAYGRLQAALDDGALAAARNALGECLALAQEPVRPLLEFSQKRLNDREAGLRVGASPAADGR